MQLYVCRKRIGIIQGSFELVFQPFQVNNSELNYMHMLQCIKNGLKIKYVSLGASLGPMKEMRMNFKHQGTVDCRQNIEMPGF